MLTASTCAIRLSDHTDHLVVRERRELVKGSAAGERLAALTQQLSGGAAEHQEAAVLLVLVDEHADVYADIHRSLGSVLDGGSEQPPASA